MRHTEHELVSNNLSARKSLLLISFLYEQMLHAVGIDIILI